MSTGAPTDSPLLSVLDDLVRAGFDSTWSMVADKPGWMICGTCRQKVDAATVHIEAWFRLEGASDPADMLAVVGGRCPNCNARGTAVLRYGPEVDEPDLTVLSALIRD